MSDGITGSIGSGGLSRSEEALVFGNGTPSHDMFARSRFFPGPQHGRWRCGLSTARLVGVDSVSHVHRDGVVGSVYEFEDAAWTDASKTITLTDAFESSPGVPLVWNDNMVVVIKSGTGWVPGIYKVATVASGDAITLADPIDADFSEVSGKWPGADNTDTLGYLCIGFYQEAYVPIGAPTGASGSGNQFNLPGVASTLFTYPISKYWDYHTCWMPPGGVGGGGRYTIHLAGRIKLAELGVHPSDSVGANAPGAYDTANGVRVCLTVDPWSSVFASLGSNHNDGSYRVQGRTLLGWKVATGARECTFADSGAGNLRILGGGGLSYLFAGDASPVRVTKFDPVDANFPSELESGATYWVDAVGALGAAAAGNGLGNFDLFLDRSLATAVPPTDVLGSAVVSVGATESLYALRFFFDVAPRVSYLRNADATAATEQISHAALANRVVGDALVCVEADASGFVEGDTYYIINKPTDTTAQVSATRGGAAFNITLDANEVSFSYTDPDAIDTEDYCKVEFEVVCDGDGSNDNNESGVRWSAVMRVLPYSETVSGTVFGANSGAGFKEYRASLSRTAPGNASRDYVDVQKATGAIQVLAKADYYTDGSANGYDAYYSTRWDYGGDYDLLHLNGDVLLHSYATSGEYDYPLESIQGVQQHGLSSQGRRATKTYVHRGAETTPLGEVVFYDQARRICAVRSLVEGETFLRGDELTFKTYRYVKAQAITATSTVPGLTWNPANKRLTKAGAFTNLGAGTSTVAITTVALNNPDSSRAHTPDFTPAFRSATKIDDNTIELATADGMPTYATSDTTLTFGGYFPYSSGSSWEFDPTPIQIRSTVRGPRFVRGSYDHTTGIITLNGSEEIAGWSWYSGAELFVTNGANFGLQAWYPVTAATATTVTITGGPVVSCINVLGQLSDDDEIVVDMVDRGPQRTEFAVRLAVTGPPSGDAEVEISTYCAALVDAGSR